MPRTFTPVVRLLLRIRQLNQQLQQTETRLRHLRRSLEFAQTAQSVVLDRLGELALEIDDVEDEMVDASPGSDRSSRLQHTLRGLLQEQRTDLEELRRREQALKTLRAQVAALATGKAALQRHVQLTHARLREVEDAVGGRDQIRAILTQMQTKSNAEDRSKILD